MTDRTPLPTLTGERITVRPPVPGELDSMAEAMATDPQVNPWWSTDADTIQRWLADPEYKVLGYRSAGAPLSVTVVSQSGPLADGELDRALTWGEELGRG